MHLPSRLFCLGPLLSLLCLTGCGNPTGTVTGKVTYQGKPVVIGSVVLINEESLAFTQETIQPDGTYQMANVPFGVLKVAVHSDDPNPANRPDTSRPVPDDLKKKPKDTAAPPRPRADKWFAIPVRSSDWRQSGLSVAIAQAHTTFDIELVD